MWLSRSLLRLHGGGGGMQLAARLFLRMGRWVWLAKPVLMGVGGHQRWRLCGPVLRHSDTAGAVGLARPVCLRHEWVWLGVMRIDCGVRWCLHRRLLLRQRWVWLCTPAIRRKIRTAVGLHRLFGRQRWVWFALRLRLVGFAWSVLWGCVVVVVGSGSGCGGGS